MALFFASLGIEVMHFIFSVIVQQLSPPT